MNLDVWRPDPFGIHEERLFRDGKPTPLVRDDGIGSYDEPPSTGAAAVRVDGRGGARARNTPRFVLVHSPLVGPTIWHWVGEILQGWGCEVVIPSMLGFEDAGPSYWEPCVQAVVLACDQVSGPLMLVGSGEAGALLPAMGLALLGRVKHIGFVEGSLPPLRGFAESAPSWFRDRVASRASGTQHPKTVQVVGRERHGEAHRLP